MNCEETILDLRDLEENINGLNGIWREHRQSKETILDST